LIVAGRGVYQHLGIQDKQLILASLKDVVALLANVNRTLREKATYQQQMEETFIKLGGPNWKKSKFYPVICSLRVSRSEVKEYLS
jgi:hypothetical protein